MYMDNLDKPDKKIIYVPLWQITHNMIKEMSKDNMDTNAKTAHKAIEKAYIEHLANKEKLLS